MLQRTAGKTHLHSYTVIISDKFFFFLNTDITVNYSMSSNRGVGSDSELRKLYA